MLGVIAVQSKKNKNAESREGFDAGLLKNRALAGLADSEDTQALMAMLRRQGGVEEAAKAAAGDPSQLMSMMNQLMHTKEGAELVERIENQAKEAGLQ